VSHNTKFKPSAVKSTITFLDRERAAEFKRYLKYGSGRAFARKPF
jgi:hypothetical protein